MATLAPLAASFRAIPLPMPRELPVIRACFPFRDISTSLSMQFNEKKITNPASFAKDLLGYLGSARASRATFGVGGNGVVSKLRKFSRAGLVAGKSTFDFMKQFPMFAALALDSGGSAPSRNTGRFYMAASCSLILV